MNMPHQILCDYLEDKGIDCRLLRLKDPGGVLFTSHPNPDVMNYGTYGQENSFGPDRDMGNFGVSCLDWQFGTSGCGYGLLTGDGYFH